MDMAKYVAVGVLAVIVLATITYDSPEKAPPSEAQAASRLEGTFGTKATSGEPLVAPSVVSTERDTPLPSLTSTADPASPEADHLSGEASATPQASDVDVGQLVRYTIEGGQTLSEVAQELLGSSRRWRELYEFNRERIPDPNRVTEGLEVVFPQSRVGSPRASTSSSNSSSTLAASAPRSGERTYVVAKGDTLYSIAKSQLGQGTRWPEIVEFNQLGSEQVRVGARLRLPQ